MSELWRALDAQCYDWAYRAYGRFTDALSPEVQHSLAHDVGRAEAHVVVYGKTQVGKTSLLLDLMGVDPLLQDRVATVLRGTRQAGRSATATAMEYRRSPDRRWGLQLGDELAWFDEDAELAGALHTLRERMERHQLRADRPCVVLIPSDCFCALPTDTAAVRMLDLPGEQAANPVEQAHVRAMARKYVGAADLVLLVGRGDELSFVQPNGLNLQGMEDWQIAPSRFRIVTTFSFTAQSVRQRVRRQQDLCAQDLRTQLVAEIEKFGPLSEAAKSGALYFPLEFGQSWEGVRQSHSQDDRELFRRLDPIVRELKSALHADIQAATLPIARLDRVLEAQGTIVQVWQRRIEGLREEVEQLGARLRKRRHQVEQFALFAQESTAQALAIASWLAENEADHVKQQLAPWLLGLLQAPGTAERAPEPQTVGDFQTVVDAWASRLLQAAEQRPARAGRFWQAVVVDANVLRTALRRVHEVSFDAFCAQLGRYWFKGYGPFGQLEKDRARLALCIEAALARARSIVGDAWMAAAQERREALERERERLVRSAKRHERIRDRSARSLAASEDKLKAVRDQASAFEARKAQDLAERTRFRDLLEQAYGEALAQRRARVFSGERAMSRFSELLACQRLMHAREQVFARLGYDTARHHPHEHDHAFATRY